MAAYIKGCTNDGWDTMQLHSSLIFLSEKSSSTAKRIERNLELEHDYQDSDDK